MRNCRLLKHYFKDTESKYLYGFILMAKGRVYNFYVESLDERESWVSALRLTVVQLNPKNEYKFGEELGTGNFAKVHLCWKKNDMSTKYAFKMIRKKAVTKTKREIVSTSTLTPIASRPNECMFLCSNSSSLRSRYSGQ